MLGCAGWWAFSLPIAEDRGSVGKVRALPFTMVFQDSTGAGWISEREFLMVCGAPRGWLWGGCIEGMDVLPSDVGRAFAAGGGWYALAGGGGGGAPGLQ